MISGSSYVTLDLITITKQSVECNRVHQEMFGLLIRIATSKKLK